MPRKGEPHDRQPSITLRPPDGSGLKVYVDHFKSLGHDAPPLWASKNPHVRRLGLYELLKVDERICSLPTELYRDDLLVPMLHRLGMPHDLHGEWLDTVLTHAAVGAQALDELDHPEPVRPTRRVGHPAADPVVLLTVWGAYLDALLNPTIGETENARYEAVSKRLGPGISRRTVHRLVRQLFQGRPGPNDPKVVAARGFRKLMCEFDEEQRGRKQARSRPVFPRNTTRH